jgi:hypothetical protein
MKGYEFSISPKNTEHSDRITLNQFDAIVCNIFQQEISDKFYCVIPELGLNWKDLMWYFMTDMVASSQLSEYFQSLVNKYTTLSQDTINNFNKIVNQYTFHYRCTETNKWYSNENVEKSLCEMLK